MLSDGDLAYWRSMARSFSIAYEDSENAIRERWQYWKAEHQSTKPSLRLAWAALGLALYGDKSAIKDLLQNLPPPPSSHEGTMQKFLVQVLIEILPLGEDFQSDYEIRKNPKPLMEWYDKHQDRLFWDSEKNAYQLSRDEED
jgi:hypothetical protein